MNSVLVAGGGARHLLDSNTTELTNTGSSELATIDDAPTSPESRSLAVTSSTPPRELVGRTTTTQ